MDIIENHEYYGTIRVIKKDTGISKHLYNKKSIWEREVLNDYILPYVKKNTTILDIGAYIGLHTLGIINHFKNIPNSDKTQLLYFEPQEYIYDNILQFNIDNSKHNIGVKGYKCGLYKEEKTVYNKKVDYDKEGNHGGIGITIDEMENREFDKIELITLDSLNLDNISFIKMDVEGKEYDVILGGIETIKRNKPIMVIEIYGGCDYAKATEEQKAKIHKVIDLVLNLGYEYKRITAHDYFFTPLDKN